MRFFRNILACLVAVVLILFLCIPVFIICGFFNNDKFLYALSRSAIKLILKIIGVKTRVHGLAAIDFSHPMVMVCNHLSNLDGPLLESILPSDPRTLIKIESRKIPFVGWVFKRADFVFVDRKNPVRRQEALTEAVAKIKEKRYSFLIFPEGTRSKSGQVQNFKKGAFKIALKAGVSVLPVKISGSYQLLPPGQIGIKAGMVDIEIFPPQVLDGIQENKLHEWIQNLQQKIYQDKNHGNH